MSSPGDNGSGHGPPGAGSRARALMLAGLGIAMVAAGVVVVARDGGVARSALRAAVGSAWWMTGGLLGLIAVNLLSVCGAFWVMTARYGRVSYREMLALITSGWLLNNLPLRPGLAGRVAYHKAVNGIGITASIKVLVQVLACAGVAVGMVLAVLWWTRGRDLHGAMMFIVLLTPALGCGAMAALARRWRQESSLWRWVTCVGFRYVDILAWAGRYWLVFAMIGRPIGAWRSGTIAAASEAAMLSPVQLGLREWVVGLTAQWTGGLSQRVGGEVAADTLRTTLTHGLIADGLNRGVEIVVGLPLGAIAIAWVMRRLRDAGRQPQTLRAGEAGASPSRERPN